MKIIVSYDSGEIYGVFTKQDAILEVKMDNLFQKEDQKIIEEVALENLKEDVLKAVDKLWMEE